MKRSVAKARIDSGFVNAVESAWQEAGIRSVPALKIGDKKISVEHALAEIRAPTLIGKFRIYEHLVDLYGTEYNNTGKINEKYI